MSLEKFKTGCSIYYDEHLNDGVLTDEDDNEILKFSYNDEHERYNLALYIGIERYSMEDIQKSHMDKSMKQMLILHFEIRQNELDMLDPNIDSDEYQEPPCSYGGRI